VKVVSKVSNGNRLLYLNDILLLSYLSKTMGEKPLFSDCGLASSIGKESPLCLSLSSFLGLV